jgi:hypothetical protein
LNATDINMSAAVKCEVPLPLSTSAPHLQGATTAKAPSSSKRPGDTASAGGAGTPKSRAPRWNIPPSALVILEEVFAAQHFPSVESRDKLAKELGVKPRQIQVWFQNRRQRERNNQRKVLRNSEDISEALLGFCSADEAEDDGTTATEDCATASLADEQPKSPAAATDVKMESAAEGEGDRKPAALPAAVDDCAASAAVTAAAMVPSPRAGASNTSLPPAGASPRLHLLAADSADQRSEMATDVIQRSFSFGAVADNAGGSPRRHHDVSASAPAASLQCASAPPASRGSITSECVDTVPAVASSGLPGLPPLWGSSAAGLWPSAGAPAAASDALCSPQLSFAAMAKARREGSGGTGLYTHESFLSLGLAEPPPSSQAGTEEDGNEDPTLTAVASDFVPSESHLLDLFLNDTVVASHCADRQPGHDKATVKGDAAAGPPAVDPIGAMETDAEAEGDRIDIDMALLCDDYSYSDGATTTP